MELTSINVSEVASEVMVPTLFRVERRRRETRDTFTLELTPTDGVEPLQFEPGQFTMLYLPGVGEVPISISGDPDESRLVQTIRAVGQVTEALTALRKGAVVGVRGPFGSAWPVEAAKGRDIVVIAGGLGLAPTRPILYHVLRHRSAYGNVNLLCGSRSLDDLLFRRELERWRSRLDLDVRVTVDHADPTWRGPVGVVTRLLPKASFDSHHTVAFVCGPEIMMHFAADALVGAGVAPANIYLSLERNMKCGVGLCGHCQLGPLFMCKDGPVVPLSRVQRWLGVREL